MKKLNLFLLASILIFTFTKCVKDPVSTQEEDTQHLETLYKNLTTMANNANCVNDENLPIAQRGFSFVAYGAKACGGPAGYIIYSNAIDKVTFLKKVKEYTEAEKKYNTKWKIFSNCMYETEPKSVECVDGEPKLIYQ